MSLRKRSSSIAGQFIAHLREMRQSVAWRCLDGNDKLTLERIEEEHVAHAGQENGRLKVTYSDFVAAGVRRNSVSTCLARVEALGFVECTDRGRASASEFRFPASYRITYLPGNTPQTHEWRTITTMEEASRRIANTLAARDQRSNQLRRKLKTKVEATPTGRREVA